MHTSRQNSVEQKTADFKGLDSMKPFYEAGEAARWIYSVRKQGGGHPGAWGVILSNWKGARGELWCWPALLLHLSSGSRAGLLYEDVCAAEP